MTRFGPPRSRFHTASLRTISMLAGALFTAAVAQPIPHFEEVAVAAGLEHSYDGGSGFVVGGGVAAFDCNGDALPDLYLAGGAAPAQLFVNRSDGRALAFEALAGPPLTGVTGAYPLDIDADGHLDLVVLRRGANAPLRGLGDCRFERADQRWGFDGGAAWSTAFAASWEPGESWPTLAVGNYIDLDHPESPFGGCAANTLQRPATGGGFAVDRQEKYGGEIRAGTARNPRCPDWG